MTQWNRHERDRNREHSQADHVRDERLKQLESAAKKAEKRSPVVAARFRAQADARRAHIERTDERRQGIVKRNRDRMGAAADQVHRRVNTRRRGKMHAPQPAESDSE